MVILATLFVGSLPAELLFNHRPLILSVDGKWYFPFIRTYSLADFGGESVIPITDYNSRELIDFLDGRDVAAAAPVDIFGSDEDEFGTADALPETDAEPSKNAHDYWMLRAPFRYDHKSRSQAPETGRVTLAAPWRSYDQYRERWFDSSWRDGHYLGTDSEGRDVLARLVYGFRVSMFFGIGLAVTGTVVGCLLGAIQGYFGGWVDLFGQRLTELWAALPRLYLLIILSSFLADRKSLSDSQHLLLLFVILNLTAWMGIATYIRAEFLKARNLEYVKAARSLGLSDFTIMCRHILPNSLTPVITFFPFEITGGILALVSLDFLGLGVRYPAPSLGDLLQQGQANLHALWIIIPTFIVLTVTITLLTFIGDGIRQAFDPRAV